VGASGAKLLSLPSTRARRRPGAPARASSFDVVERDAERVEVEQQGLLCRPDPVEAAGEAFETVDVGRAWQRDAVELDRVAVPGTPTENDCSIAIRNSLFSGSSSTSPLTENAVDGTGACTTGSVNYAHCRSSLPVSRL